MDLLQERLEKLDDAVAGCIEVRTIDGFQGREMEAIIFTFTRSNVKGNVFKSVKVELLLTHSDHA